MPPNNYQSILSQLYPIQPAKRKVFVSYHHQDQAMVDSFRTTFGSAYDVFTDNSLDRVIDSMDTLYVNRTISENYITGTSITIVLCGADTWKRKYIDWEIHSTLEKDHALLGVIIPATPLIWQNGQYVTQVPNRLHANVVSNYAHAIHWPVNAQLLNEAIEHAVWRSTQNRQFKNNSADKMGRNLS
jgi:hypothetical protein